MKVEEGFVCDVMLLNQFKFKWKLILTNSANCLTCPDLTCITYMGTH